MYTLGSYFCITCDEAIRLSITIKSYFDSLQTIIHYSKSIKEGEFMLILYNVMGVNGRCRV
jgi:hypothetical protein